MRLKRLWRLLNCDASAELEAMRAQLATMQHDSTEAMQMACARLEILESSIVQLASEFNEFRNSVTADMRQTEQTPSPRVRTTKRFSEFAKAAVAAQRNKA